MRVRLRVNHSAFERVRTQFNAAQLTEGDRRTVVLRVLDRVHRDQVKRAFATRGASTGASWPALSPRYEKWKRQGGYGSRMMRMRLAYRGRGADQLYRKAALAGEQGHVAQWLGALRYAFGFDDDVGSYHEHGTRRLPVRSLIRKTAADYQEFTAAVAEFWRKRLEQVFRYR